MENIVLKTEILLEIPADILNDPKQTEEYVKTVVRTMNQIISMSELSAAPHIEEYIGNGDITKK